MLVNSWTNWGTLEEVWLGDVYPATWYDHLESEVRDCFYEITENTKHDLNIIQRKLEELNVSVVRPAYNNIDDYIDNRGFLSKPRITPRDNHLVYGNKLVKWNEKVSPWQDAIDRYNQDCSGCVQPWPDTMNTLGPINGANTVRVGKDLYLDISSDNAECSREQQIQDFYEKVVPLWPNSRIHLLDNGGHIDACFAVAKPGVLITSAYYNEYYRTFPDWHTININKPEFYEHSATQRSGPDNNGQWYMPGMHNKYAFQDHIVKHAMEWIGDYTETYFEVNCLVVDEKNILMLGHNEKVAHELEQHGMTVHWVPFRTRTFWDGGLHCLTLDIRRQDTAVDLFPERTEKIYIY